MAKISHEYENLILSLRRTMSQQGPEACEMLDELSRRTTQCFHNQKRNLQWGFATQAFFTAAGVGVGYGLGRIAFNSIPASALTKEQVERYKTAMEIFGTVNGIGAKTGEMLKGFIEASNQDYQAEQQRIQVRMTELNTIQQSRQTFLQTLQYVLQQLQQNEEAAKMR